MNLRRFAKRDRYGVIRGTALMCVVLLLCTCMLIEIFHHYDTAVETGYVSAAVRQAAAQVDQLVADCESRILGWATILEEGEIEGEALLQLMQEDGSFEDAAIYTDAVQSDLVHISEADRGISTLYIDGKIRISMPVDGGVIVGWISQDKLAQILGGLHEGDYGYALYNSATGAYILKCDYAQPKNYYDFLLMINDKGKAGALLNNDDAYAYIAGNDNFDGGFYVVQRQTAVPDVGVSLRIPRALFERDDLNIFILAIVASAVVMLAILISYTVFSLRRVQRSNRNVVQALNNSERMLEIVTQDTHVTLFVYHRGQAELVSFYDGLGLIENNGYVRIHTLSEFESSAELDESETARIREGLRSLEPGKSAEISVRTTGHNSDVRTLRFIMYASENPDHGIICSISDCTREQDTLDRAEIENSYCESVRSKVGSIWQINISRNRWSMLYSRQKKDHPHFLHMDANCWRDYNADLGGRLREYLHPADYEAYAEAVSIVGIASAFRSGRSDFTLDYRVLMAGSEDYEWHRMRVRIWLNPQTSDILANLYIFNVNAEKNAELERGERKRIKNEALRALGSIYYGLYYVDLENDLCYAAKSLDKEMVTQLCSPYKSTFEGYIDASVHPDDRDELRRMLSAYAIRRSMTEGSHFQRLEYRRKVGDGYEQAAIIVQPARFENAIVKEVVLAIRYISRDGKRE